MYRVAVVAIMLAACGGEKRAPASAVAGDAAAVAPRAAVTVEGCRLAWRPTEDAVMVAAPAPVPAKSGKKIKKPAEPRPKVTLLPPVVVGTMSKELVTRSMKKSVEALESCYREAIGRSPALAGQVTAIFTIDATGAVIAARVSGPDDRLDGCLAAAIRAIQFAKPKRGGGVQVRYPLDLRVESAPAPDAEELIDGGVSVQADLAWADEGVDPAVERWAAEQLAPAVRAASADLDACGLGDLTGSLRAQIAVDRDGAVLDVEVAGLGAAVAEDCVRERLARLVVPAPPLAVAAACDITAHEPRPWRVTVRPGQSVIDVGAGQGATEPSAGTGPIVVRVDPSASAVAVAEVASRLRAPYLIGVQDGDDLLLISDRVPRGVGPSSGSPRPRTRIALGGDPRALAASAVCTDCDHVVEIAPGTADAAALRALVVALREVSVERIILVEAP